MIAVGILAEPLPQISVFFTQISVLLCQINMFIERVAEFPLSIAEHTCLIREPGFPVPDILLMGILLFTV